MAATAAPAGALAPIPPLRSMSGRRTTKAHLADILRYRELLVLLMRKELTVRYKSSAIGFVWSMLQPLFFLVVYTAVFAILGAGFERFAIWVLCGLLVWTLISSSLVTSTVSITSNAALVGKVKFPRAVLPLASVGGALVHFCLQFVAFAIVLAASTHPVDWRYVWLLPVALLSALVLCTASGLFLAPSNVYARDTGHLLELLVLGWFWATPVLYDYNRAATWLSAQGLPDWLLLLNPATPIVITFQRALYGTDHAADLQLLPSQGPAWYLGVIVATTVVWGAICLLGLRTFDRAETNLAENL
jgi:ABC-2 type transport system permease protein